MIEELIKINNKLIDEYQNDYDNLHKQLLIKKILKEPNCFLKMSIENAYSILKDLKIPSNKMKDVYKSLI